jgi:hypothetical protein
VGQACDCHNHCAVNGTGRSDSHEKPKSPFWRLNWKMKKKGMESTMVTIALFVVFALLILVAVGRFAYFVLFQSSETICEQSIVQSGLGGLPEFKCDANYETISKADSSSDGNPDDAVKRKVSDMMYMCWKKTGKGLVDPYKASYEIQSLYIGQVVTNVYLICDVIEYKDIPNFKGLLYWQAMNKPNQGKTPFFDSLYGKRPIDEELKQLELKEDTYNTSQRYAIAWKYSKKGLTVTNSIAFLPYGQLASSSWGLFKAAQFDIVMN